MVEGWGGGFILLATHCLDLIAMKCHPDIPYGNSYLVMVESLKKNNQREVTQKELRKRQHSFFFFFFFFFSVRDTPSQPHTHCYKVSSRYSICLPSYTVKKKKKRKKKTFKGK